MKTISTSILRILIAASLFTLPAHSQETDGFVNMFNGKDLTGWKTNGNWVIEENINHQNCGGIIRTQAASKNMVKPAGEWNRYTITLKGNSLKVVMNGEQIIDIDLSNSAMKDRPAKGHIGF